MYSRWCATQILEVLAVQGAHIELYARWLEEQGRATIARRLSTIVGLYRYAEEHLIEGSPGRLRSPTQARLRVPSGRGGMGRLALRG